MPACPDTAAVWIASDSEERRGAAHCLTCETSARANHRLQTQGGHPSRHIEGREPDVYRHESVGALVSPSTDPLVPRGTPQRERSPESNPVAFTDRNRRDSGCRNPGS
jgi:hypothetical protein